MADGDGIVTTDGGVWEEIYGWKLEVGDEVTLTWYDGEQGT